MVQLLAAKIQPLIYAAFGALICADQRNAVSANPRFLFPCDDGEPN